MSDNSKNNKTLLGTQKRIIYILIALAGIWCISLLFKSDDEVIEHHA